MSELSSTSALTSRHLELGSGLKDWNDMGTAWSYHSDANDEHDDALAGGEILKLNGNNVGVINSPCWSHRLNQSLALVHLHPDAAAQGTRLEVASDDFNGRATVVSTPFFDPEKARTHA